MKKLKLTIGTLLLAAAFVACDNTKEKEAQKLVADYTTYVDSVSDLSMENSSSNWDAIAAEHDTKKMKAESAVTGVEDKTKAENEIESASMTFETYQMEVQKTKAKMHKDELRNSLFGMNKVGDDMSFAWVNKDNILGVYENFVNTVKTNKDNYSREDWDEIKLLYEALDTRKNTVENEGLSTEDNLKIAKLKVEFSPMYTVNRMGAKAEENNEAKE